jgi:hypothetical protein
MSRKPYLIIHPSFRDPIGEWILAHPEYADAKLRKVIEKVKKARAAEEKRSSIYPDTWAKGPGGG